MWKIIPAGMTFERALRAGLTGRIECRPYLDWLKTLPCDTCGAPPPSDPSHYNGFKGMGTKAPDLLSLPQCRKCHEDYERIGCVVFVERCAVYLLQAFWEGHLKWVP